jgi:hypothetical protein
MFYFGISKYLNFMFKFKVRVQISETMRCLHPITRETSEIDSKGQSTPVACFHMHGAMAAPYWPILACGTRVQVKTQYFEKFKINISTCRIQTKLST